MNPGAWIIGVGQEHAGDDGVGLEVVRALRARGEALPGVELVELRDPSLLLPLLLADRRVVIVDAVLGSPAGEVLELTEDALERSGWRSVSSHGFGVAGALELAALLRTEPRSAPVQLVGVRIGATPRAGRSGLSPEVRDAVPRAVERVLRAVTSERSCDSDSLPSPASRTPPG